MGTNKKCNHRSIRKIRLDEDLSILPIDYVNIASILPVQVILKQPIDYASNQFLPMVGQSSRYTQELIDMKIVYILLLK